mmetsp:Transcript_1983/g.3828  ORF Transcript_1983/g.3828 Transcript_1983/m.3828 type:complete len:98 (+) Transcript_1983:2696-2989(+)
MNFRIKSVVAQGNPQYDVSSSAPPPLHCCWIYIMVWQRQRLDVHFCEQGWEHDENHEFSNTLLFVCLQLKTRRLLVSKYDRTQAFYFYGGGGSLFDL